MVTHSGNSPRLWLNAKVFADTSLKQFGPRKKNLHSCHMNIFQKSFLKLSTLAIVAVLAGTAFSQQDSNSSTEQQSDASLAAAAKEARKNKNAHAKKVVTDDDVVPQRGPLPALSFNGDDNVDRVIEAIGEYKKTHTKEETEQVAA